MLPVGKALDKFDLAVVSWVAVPSAPITGQFTLAITVLVWRDTLPKTRRAIRRALEKYFDADVLWHIVEDLGPAAGHVNHSVRLITKVVNYQSDV